MTNDSTPTPYGAALAAERVARAAYYSAADELSAAVAAVAAAFAFVARRDADELSAAAARRDASKAEAKAYVAYYSARDAWRDARDAHDAAD